MKVIRTLCVSIISIICCVIMVLGFLISFVIPQAGIRESFLSNKEIYKNVTAIRTDFPTTFLCKKGDVDPSRMNIVISDMNVITNEKLNNAQIKLLEQSKVNKLFVFPSKKKPSISQITIKESYVVFDENTAIKKYGIIYLPDENNCPLDFKVLIELEDDWYYFEYGR